MEKIAGAIVVVGIVSALVLAGNAGMKKVEANECVGWKQNQSDYAANGYRNQLAGISYPSASDWQIAQCAAHGIALVGEVDNTKE